MPVHPRDKNHPNPRIQCSVCGKWQRLYAKKPDPETGLEQRFFGGCGATGGDHLAGDKIDVCERCCRSECRRLQREAGKPVFADSLKQPSAIIPHDHTRNHALENACAKLAAESCAARLSALAFEVRSGTVGELDNGWPNEESHSRCVQEKLCDRARVRPDAPIFFAFR